MKNNSDEQSDLNEQPPEPLAINQDRADVAFEELLAREKEKSILLSISEAIASVSNRKQLLKVIYERIQPIFPFDNAGLFVIDVEKDQIYEMLDGEAFPDGLQQQLTEQHKLGPWPLSTSNPQSWWMRDEISINTLSAEADLATNHLGYEQFEVGLAHGLNQLIAGPLKANGKKIGAICFNSKTEGLYTTHHFPMFKSISEQIGVAMANILANEELLHREKEKELLYNIASSIANIQDRVSLMKFIMEEVKSIFNFYDVGLMVLDKDGDKGLDWAIQYPEIDPSEANYNSNALNLAKAPYKNSLLEKSVLEVEAAGRPLVYKINEQLKNDNPDYKELLQAEISFGFKETLFTYLKCGNKIIGTFNINSLTDNHFQASQFHLFQAVADLIAVAVANILAREEILEREKEKSQLLEITELIAQIKDNSDLLRLIVSKIKPIFNFHDCGLFIVNSDGETHTDLAAVILDVSPSDWNQRIALVSRKIEHADSLIEWMMGQIDALGQPIVFDFVELVKKFPSYPQFDGTGIVEMGYRDCLAFNLKIRGKNIGMFCINALQKDFFSPTVFPIFQSVTESISIAVANILANEEILEREKEKELLYNIASAIANIQDRVSLMKFILNEIKHIFNFYDVGLVVLNPDGNTGIDWAIHTPQIDPSLTNYELNTKGLLLVPYKNSLLEKLAKTVQLEGNPVIVKFDDQLLAENPDLKSILEVEIKHGYKEALFTYLKCGDKIIGTFNINSLKDKHFKATQFTLFQAVADQIAVAVSNILGKEEIETLNKQLQAQNAYLVQEVEQVYNFEEMIGQNPKFIEVCQSIGLVANTSSTVLILGETGTGKELVARAIHNNSTRKNKPLIKLNCAALPANLIESELFGHERGAFTGAVDKRIGKFELAHGSTLFLDEVGELPLELQAKLLRALQEKEIERLGSNKTLQIDVRIIAATNRDLLKEVQAGTFRQDLYYRLHIFPITLPPLRERKEDIPLLALHFIERYAKKIGKKIQGLSSNAMQEMMQYSWPGNIRELEHVIERCVILSQTKLIQELNLPNVAKNKTALAPREFVLKTWEEQERDYILEVLKITNGNVRGKGGAAELLQLAPSTLQSKMLKLGIKRKPYSE